MINETIILQEAFNYIILYWTSLNKNKCFYNVFVKQSNFYIAIKGFLWQDKVMLQKRVEQDLYNFDVAYWHVTHTVIKAFACVALLPVIIVGHRYF